MGRARRRGGGPRGRGVRLSGLYVWTDRSCRGPRAEPIADHRRTRRAQRRAHAAVTGTAARRTAMTREIPLYTLEGVRDAEITTHWVRPPMASASACAVSPAAGARRGRDHPRAHDLDRHVHPARALQPGELSPRSRLRRGLDARLPDEQPACLQPAADRLEHGRLRAVRSPGGDRRVARSRAATSRST